MTNSDVVYNWATRKVNPYCKRIEWNSGNINGNGKAIKSYGWFPMAYHLGKVGEDHIFLKNGDRYSSSTSQHQSAVQQYCKGPTIPFSSLESAGINPYHITFDNIISWAEDTRIPIWRYADSDTWYQGYWRAGRYDIEGTVEFVRPQQGMMINVHPYGNDGRVIEADWHILGGAVIEWDGHWYLCALDEGTYFISELQWKPLNVEHAIKLLKPVEVSEAEDAGRDIQRQGEWFFVAYPECADRNIADVLGYKTLKEMRANLKPHALPDDSAPAWNRNVHEVRHLVHETGIYAKGKVYHRDRWGNLTGEHRSLNLGNVWHMVYENTAVRSWSSGGRVD